ncbi:MAG: hypothetical protein PHF61_06775 [Bacteroidales bacterium]|jgi:hypothetical protein|nr:hypothetical protein [Bacteroidales bacterium]
MSKLLKGFLGVYNGLGSNNKLMLYDDYLEVHGVNIPYNQINEVTLSKASFFVNGYIRIYLKKEVISKLNLLKEYTINPVYTIWFDKVRSDSAEEIKKIIETKLTWTEN